MTLQCGIPSFYCNAQLHSPVIHLQRGHLLGTLAGGLSEREKFFIKIKELSFVLVHSLEQFLSMKLGFPSLFNITLPIPVYFQVDYAFNDHINNLDTIDESRHDGSVFGQNY